MKGIIDGKIRPEKIEAAQARINELLDQSVITAADARKYTITEAGKELDLSKLDIDELRSQFKKLKTKILKSLICVSILKKSFKRCCDVIQPA